VSDAPGNRPWNPITPLDVNAVSANGRIAAVDALREAWRAQLAKLAEDDRKKARQRTLRKLAIETGIIERLYDIDWGLTLTLIAEGFARDVVERASGQVDDHTLATLIAQRDSLELVIDFVKQNRRLTPSFIKQLHHALTRTQTHYTAVDALGPRRRIGFRRPGRDDLRNDPTGHPPRPGRSRHGGHNDDWPIVRNFRQMLFQRVPINAQRTARHEKAPVVSVMVPQFDKHQRITMAHTLFHRFGRNLKSFQHRTHLPFTCMPIRTVPSRHA
jgi:hypothetical protein